MELRPSYKQTEVGVIPEDWDVTVLGRTCVQVTTGKLDANAMKPSGQYRFYTCAKDYCQIDTFAFDTEALLVSGNGANVGYIHYYKGKFNAYQRTYVLSGFLESIKYLQHYMGQKLADRIRVEVNAGNTPYITRGTLTEMKVALPTTKAEQEAIADALSDADALIESLEQLIAKKRHLKQGAMQELLTGKKRLPGFSGEWEVKRLGDVGSFSKGRGLSKGELVNSGSVPAIPYTAIYTDFAEVIAYSKIAHFINSPNNAVIINGPHLLIAGSSNMLENIGKAAAYVDNTDVAVGGDIIIYRTTAHVRFLSYLLSTQPHRKRVVFLSQGSTIRHVYFSTFERYELALPSHREQTAIAEVLSDMDAELAALEQRRDKTRALKQGMMQELLTGRIRLV